MKNLIILFFFIFSIRSYSLECNYFGLRESQKEEINQKINKELELALDEFFIKKRIKLIDQKISFQIIDDNYPDNFGHESYSVHLDFKGITERSILRNKIGNNENSGFEAAYSLDFFIRQPRDEEGVPKNKTCKVLIWSRGISIYNISYDNFLIGTAHPREVLIMEFDKNFEESY